MDELQLRRHDILTSAAFCEPNISYQQSVEGNRRHADLLVARAESAEFPSISEMDLHNPIFSPRSYSRLAASSLDARIDRSV
jgi:hypothetical protein